jgi:UTP--glucose-1-phosphate uridylyltransferase
LLKLAEGFAMKVTKAVITAAGPDQRALPLQTLIDREGEQKSVLAILIEQALTGAVDQVCVVVYPGDEERYAQVIGTHRQHVRFISQSQPLGYGFALYSAREFTGEAPFLHLVGDHMYAGAAGENCTAQLLEVAQSQRCSVSAVQATRESLLPRYGTIGGRRLPGTDRLYRIDTVAEKPTPTEAEQHLLIPGMRAGHYLCFFGMHVLTPSVMDILGRMHDAAPDRCISLSSALAELARAEQYLALEAAGRRYDIGSRYGLLVAQMALALSGRDRSEVLARVLELLADREASFAAAGSAR